MLSDGHAGKMEKCKLDVLPGSSLEGSLYEQSTSDATCTGLIWILDKIKLAFERELETFCIHCMFEVMLVL